MPCVSTSSDRMLHKDARYASFAASARASMGFSHSAEGEESIPAAMTAFAIRYLSRASRLCESLRGWCAICDAKRMRRPCPSVSISLSIVISGKGFDFASDAGESDAFWTLGPASVSEDAVAKVQSESKVAMLGEGRRREGRRSNVGFCRLELRERVSEERLVLEVDPVRERDRNLTLANSTRYGMPNALKRTSGAISIGGGLGMRGGYTTNTRLDARG